MIYILLIYHRYFRTKKIYIPRIFLEHECIFLRENFMFHDAVNIHDVTSTTNTFPYTAKFMVVGVRNHKIQQVRR